MLEFSSRMLLHSCRLLKHVTELMVSICIRQACFNIKLKSIASISRFSTNKHTFFALFSFNNHCVLFFVVVVVLFACSFVFVALVFFFMFITIFVAFFFLLLFLFIPIRMVNTDLCSPHHIHMTIKH